MKNFVIWALLISLTAVNSSFADTSSQSRLSGQITVDSNPISDAVVTLYLLNKTQSGYEKSISSRTSVSGHYRFNALQNGNYVLIVTKGGQRVYQGKIGVNGQTIKDIDLTAFLFAGNWKLNLQKSKLPDSYTIVDETRSYSKKGDFITVLWNRTFKDGTQTTGKYELKCDGKKWVTGNQTISCTYEFDESTAVVKGEMSPPHVYFRNEVKNSVLMISRYSDIQHEQLLDMYTFDPRD